MSIRRNKNTIKQRKRRMEKNLYSLHVINKKMALNKYYYKSQRYLYSFLIILVITTLTHFNILILFHYVLPQYFHKKLTIHVIYIVLFYALHRAVALFC